MAKRSGPNLPLLIAGLVGTALMLALLGSGFGKDPHALPFVLGAKPAPDFQLVDLDGQPVQLSALKGRPVVLNFWSTWCLPCREEHADLQAAARRWPDVIFYGVLYGDTPEKARAFLRNTDHAYPTLVDPEGRTAIDFGVTGVPETYFIDARGTLVYKHPGPLTMPQLAQLLDAR